MSANEIRPNLRELGDVDPSSLDLTPRALYDDVNYHVLDYEEGMERLELPEYAELKALRQKCIIVSKVRHKTNFVNLT